MTKKKLSDIRNDYTHANLTRKDLLKNPFDMLTLWLDEAIDFKVIEPTAMFLATVGTDGRPTGRIVLLKEITHENICFFTNYNSRKSQQLNANPFAAATIFWPEMERQIRIEGSVTKTDSSVSDQYFYSRPEESQISAWVSPQSEIIPDREFLTAAFDRAKKEFKSMKTIPRPSNWGGFQLAPNQFEFWQGRPGRLHDRFQYSLADGQWVVNQLAP